MHARNAIAGAARRCKCFPLKNQKNSFLQTVHRAEGYSPAKNGAIAAINRALTGKSFSNFSRDGIFRDFSSFSAAKNPESSENDENFDSNYVQVRSSIHGQRDKKNKFEIAYGDNANEINVGGPASESRAVKGKGKGKVRNGKNDSAKGKDNSWKQKEKSAKKVIDWEELEKEEGELESQMQNKYNVDELLPKYSPSERQQKAANVARILASLKLSHGTDNSVSDNSSTSNLKVNRKRIKENEKLEKVKGKIANKFEEEEEEEEEEVQESSKVSDDWFPQLSPEEKLRRSSRLAKSLLEASLEGPDDEEEEEEQENIRREEQRSLTVGIVGPPNAGKSTLTNFMLGKKVAAVSRKTNTTTHEILGVLTKGDTQILFFDTPGIGLNNAGYPSKTDVRQRFESSWSSVQLYDLLIVIIDAHRHLEKPDPRVRKLVNQLGQEVHPMQKRILCMNKVDLVKQKKDLLKVANEFGQLPGYDKFYMISSMKGSGVKDLLRYFMEQAVRRPWDEAPWDEDPMTLDEDILKSTSLEVVREKMLHYIHQEIPYQIDHRLIDWREMEDGSLRIEQHFIVHKHTHRRIIVGKNGSKIREIGMAANEELRSLFKRTIHLMIQVTLKS